MPRRIDPPSPDVKWCGRCKDFRPRTDFHRNKSSRDGLYGFCKPCTSAAARDWRQEHGNRVSARRHHLRRYGIDLERYEAMLAEQGDKCAICGTPDPGWGNVNFTIDHDHACCNTKRGACGLCVRALLCARCNSVLGLVEDTPEILTEMAAYLARHKKEA